MATYNPQRKTNEGTENVEFPISAIEGLADALNGKMPYIEIDITDMTMWEFKTVVENAGLLEQWFVAKISQYSLRSIWLVRVALAYSTNYYAVSIDLSDRYHRFYESAVFNSTSTTTVDNWINNNPILLQPQSDDNLSTTDKTIVGAINEVNEKIPNNAIPSLDINLGTNNTIGELVTVLRENGITTGDSCLIHCIYPNAAQWFENAIVRFSDTFANSLVTIYEWYAPSNPINYTASGISASTTIGEIEATINNLLNTVDKTIVGAINEVNGKTVPSATTNNSGQVLTVNDSGTPEWKDGIGKISTIDTWWLGLSFVGYDDEGIAWNDGFAFLDEDDNVIKEGTITQKIPITAGENVTFSYNETYGTIAINATGKSNTEDSMVGTWVFNDTLSGVNGDTQTLPDDGYTFITGSNTSRRYYESETGFIYCEEQENGNTIFDGIVYYYDNGWEYDEYKTLPITEEPPAEASAWVRANAKKQGSSSGSSAPFELPRIRFANYILMDNGDGSATYRFTVENLGGGTLQVGDKLQICCRRKYGGGKRKLRKMAEVEITTDDLTNRFLKIEVTTYEDDVWNGDWKWLFRNDHAKASQSQSAIYFRLKRVTAYDGNGNECNAIFSNVETVWKTYSYSNKLADIFSLQIK